MIVFILFLFLIIIWINNTNNNIYFIMSYLYSKMEYKKIDNYFKFCNNNKQKRIIFSYKINPIISIISPFYNREIYIFRFIKNIQYQNFEKIELIIIDDNSNDNSIQIIEKYKAEDSRIILLKNKKNKGTLISRNLGSLYSRGKYIMLPDSDDILSKNIINICYKLSEKYKIEMIRFNGYLGKGRLIYENKVKHLETRIIYQPYLIRYLYHGNGEIQRIDGYLHNKFIKKEVFLKAVNILSKFYLNIHMIYLEDVLLTHALYIVAKSFCFFKFIGYFYTRNSKSITKNNLISLKIKSILILLNFAFEYYKNNKYERDIVNNLIYKIEKIFYLKKIKNIHLPNDTFNIYCEFMNKFANYKYVNENQKLLYNLKSIFLKKNNKNNINNYSK